MKLWIEKNNFEKLRSTRFSFTLLVTLLEPSEANRRKYIELSSYDEEISLEENKEIVRLRKENNELKTKVGRYEAVIRKFYKLYKNEIKRASF